MNKPFGWYFTNGIGLPADYICPVCDDTGDVNGRPCYSCAGSYWSRNISRAINERINVDGAGI